jgi:hypothetical protein
MRRLASMLISSFADVVEQLCPLLDGGFVVFGLLQFGGHPLRRQRAIDAYACRDGAARQEED